MCSLKSYVINIAVVDSWPLFDLLAISKSLLEMHSVGNKIESKCLAFQFVNILNLTLSLLIKKRSIT